MKLSKLRYGTILLAGMLIISWASQLSIPSADAVSTNVTLRPISTISNSAWTTTGTFDNSCTGACGYIDESISDGDTSYLNGAAGQAPTATFGMGGGSTSGQVATSVEVHVVGRAGANGGLGYRPLDVTITIGGVTQPTQSVTWSTQVYTDSPFTFTGTWSKSDVDNATVTISKTQNGLQPAIRVSTLYAVVTYQSPAQDQNATRLYANADNAAPGSPLAATNTAAEVGTGVPFRLRGGLTVSDTDWQTGSWGPHNNTYKLQYAALSAASCSAQATGWTDVASGSGAVRWYNNASVADNAAIASIGANDPTTGGTKVYQTYRESNGFTNTSSIAVGNTGIWDFALTTVGQVAGTSFCFRIIQNDGTLLNAYSTFPKITLTGDLGVDIVDAGGSTVATPTVAFSSIQTATTQCNTATATLGVSSQKIRIINDLVTNGWNLSLAATGGSTSTWNSGSHNYDFNDPGGSPNGCSDGGGDADAYAGQLTVNAAGATVTPAAGCSSTGLSGGSNAAFNEGTTNAITLQSADASSSRFCYWDITNIGLSQKVPSATAAGTYTMDVTLTLTAL